MRLFSSGDLLGLGRENNTKEDSGVIAKSCYGDRKVWFSFSVSRLSVGINGFCIPGVLDTSVLGEFDVREKNKIQSYTCENVLNLCHLYCL